MGWPYTRSSNDPHLWHDFDGAAGACFWELSERVPEPLARGRERGEAALALPKLRTDAGLVGERAGGELGCAAGAVQDV